MPIFDEMEKQKCFTFIMSRHEQGAAFMADGYARASGRPAAVLTLRNPTLPARILTSLTQASLPWQFAAAFVMLVPSLIVIFVIRRYLLGLWGRVVK